MKPAPDRHFLNIMARNPHLPRPEREGSFRLFDEIYEGQLWTGFLGGEPIHLIYAPKHSYTDQLLLFRGAMDHGRLVSRRLRDCNALVRPEQGAVAIDQAVGIVRGLATSRAYAVFLGHGDCLYYGGGLETMMARSKVYH